MSVRSISNDKQFSTTGSTNVSFPCNILQNVSPFCPKTLKAPSPWLFLNAISRVRFSMSIFYVSRSNQPWDSSVALNSAGVIVSVYDIIWNLLAVAEFLYWGITCKMVFRQNGISTLDQINRWRSSSFNFQQQRRIVIYQAFIKRADWFKNDEKKFDARISCVQIPGWDRHVLSGMHFKVAWNRKMGMLVVNYVDYVVALIMKWIERQVDEKEGGAFRQ